jgi:hypothetical protein
MHGRPYTVKKIDLATRRGAYVYEHLSFFVYVPDVNKHKSCLKYGGFEGILKGMLFSI